jgi:hypothetical protein
MTLMQYFNDLIVGVELVGHHRPFARFERLNRFLPVDVPQFDVAVNTADCQFRGIERDGGMVEAGA